MPYYAQTDNAGVVVSVSELAGEVTGPNLVRINTLDTGLLGCTYDGTSFTPPPPPPPKPRIITKVAMLTRRLTQAEFVGILIAAKSDPAIEAWKYVFDAANTIDLDGQNTREGMALLVRKGLLTQERADQILNAPVQPEERA
jgi:hypothetical protein